MAKEHKEKKRRRLLVPTLIGQIRRDKKAYVVYVILQVLILATIVRNVWMGRYETLFTAVLAQLLLLIPPFLEKSFHVDIPTTLEICAYIFVFCAEILGEIENFYVLFPFWDTALHTFNGFMFAAFGFCLMDILNQSDRFRFQLSPLSLAFVAFCFSMTIGVLWEFLEFSADMLLKTDMQKDVFITGFGTVSLPNDAGAKVTQIRDIATTTVTLSDGSTVTMNGYLDVGLRDTIKDLFVNFIGAVVFSVIGYIYVRQRGRGRLAPQFIPVYEGVEPKPAEAQSTENAENTADSEKAENVENAEKPDTSAPQSAEPTAGAAGKTDDQEQTAPQAD